MEKSFVTLEQQVCLICGKTYDTGSLLLDKRMKARFDMYTVTGNGLCPEHEKLHKDGYIALVECDPEKSSITGSTVHRPEECYRTGRLAHVKREVAKSLFNITIPNDMPLMYVEPAVIDYLEKLPKEGE